MFKYRRCRIWRSSREKMPEGSLESAYSCDWPEVLCQRLVFRRCTRSVVCCQKGDACLFGHTLLTHQCIAMCHSRVWSESFCFAFLSLPGLGLTKRHKICQSLLGSCGGWLFEEAIKLLWMQDQLNFLSHSHSQHQNSAKKPVPGLPADFKFPWIMRAKNKHDNNLNQNHPCGSIGLSTTKQKRECRSWPMKLKFG